MQMSSPTNRGLPPSSHQGRVALVTGAANGIGRAIALELGKRGAQLVLVDLEDAAATAAELDSHTLVLRADVSQDSDWQRVAREVDARFGRCDIVVNNAAYMKEGTIDQLDYETWRRGLAVNLDAHFLSAKHFVPRMRRNHWGRFVGISSNSIGTPVQGLSHYMASKMGVIGFMRGLANDVGPDGITANAVLPAITNTRASRGLPEEFKRSVWQQQAIKRFAEPEDIVGPVVFLTSDDAAFVTGQALVADGGLYKIS
jgi:NAD(P)-dependent dehydrogenase (short-subunit alcohol dehydrogenase family)